jgi:hypothetical protein
MGSCCNERRASLSRGAQMPDRASTPALRQASRCLSKARRRTWAPGNPSDIFTRYSFSLARHHQSVRAPDDTQDIPARAATITLMPYYLEEGDEQELLLRSNAEYKPAVGVTRPSNSPHQQLHPHSHPRLSDISMASGHQSYVCKAGAAPRAKPEA